VRTTVLIVLLLALSATFGSAGSAADDNSGVLEQARTAMTGNDLAAARKILDPLSAKGDAAAQNLYGDFWTLSGDLSTAFSWYRKAAEQGNAKGQNNLGMAYILGKGVSADAVAGASWLRKAAEQGHMKAQNNLSVLYATGRGVTKSDTESANWCRKAAEQGDPAAQYNLAIKYQLGSGVEKDEGEALTWFQKAAEQRFPAAQDQLVFLLPPARRLEQGAIMIKPGENVSLAYDLTDGQLTRPHLVKANANAPSSTDSQKSETFDLSMTFDPKAPMTLLQFKSHSSRDVIYDCSFKIAGESILHRTSVVPVGAGMVSYESWPYPIEGLMISNLRFARRQ